MYPYGKMIFGRAVCKVNIGQILADLKCTKTAVPDSDFVQLPSAVLFVLFVPLVM